MKFEALSNTSNNENFIKYKEQKMGTAKSWWGFALSEWVGSIFLSYYLQACHLWDDGIIQRSKEPEFIQLMSTER